MDEPTRQFLADAMHIRLTADEKSHLRDDLALFVTGEVSVEELEKDPAIKEFLQEAAGISLTVDETALSKSDLTYFMAERSVENLIDGHSDALGDLNEISLSERERSDMRRGLISFMEQKRLQQAASEERLTLREYMLDFWRVIVPRTAVLACAFLLVSTGVAFAAEGSFPGDWLYPLKVQVFEHVRGRFIFTSEEKAQWEATRAMRRLEEAVWLAAHDDLTKANWLGLHGNFVEHVMQAERHIDMLAERGDVLTAEHLSADLDAHLRAHRTVLQSIGLKHSDKGIETAIEDVKDAQQNVSRRLNERAISGVHTDPDDGQKSAEAGIQSATVELRRAKRDRGLSDSSRASERLEKAEALLLKAETQLNARQYENAEAAAREALKTAAEAKLLGNLPSKNTIISNDQDETAKEANGGIINENEKIEINEEIVVDEENDGIFIQQSPDVTDADYSEGEKETEAHSSSGEEVEENGEPDKAVDAADIEVIIPAVNVDVDLEGLLP